MTTVVEEGKLGRVCPPLVSEDRTEWQAGPPARLERTWTSVHLPRCSLGVQPGFRAVGTTSGPFAVPALGRVCGVSPFPCSHCCCPGLGLVVRESRRENGLTVHAPKGVPHGSLRPSPDIRAKSPRMAELRGKELVPQKAGA